MDLFTPQPLTGQDLANEGMNKALTHANDVVDNWGERAYGMLERYIASFGAGYQFKGEQVRNYAEAHKLPTPPSLRAWGSIMVRAAKSGLIKKVGYAQVDNIRAHSANCSLWEVV